MTVLEKQTMEAAGAYFRANTGPTWIGISAVTKLYRRPYANSGRTIQNGIVIY